MVSLLASTPGLCLIRRANEGLNEAYSGFGNVGHNTVPDLILLWIVPKYVSLTSRS